MADIFTGKIKITGTITVNFMITRFGKDLLIALSGGEEHIGAVSIHTPFQVKSWRRPEHKEYILTEKIKEVLTPLLPHRAVVILAGIHYDHLREEEIELIVKKCGEWAEKIPELIKVTEE
jgi:hypothetical protein